MANTVFSNIGDLAPPASRPLWRALQLPNLLALDAPLVAVSWHWLLLATTVPHTAAGLSAGTASQAPPDAFQPAMLLLFATVWLIYMADRLLDGQRLDFQRDVPPRHRFARRWASLLWPLWAVVLLATGTASWLFLPAELLLLGSVLLAAVLVYCWAVHGCAATRKRIPKEFIVGTIFALGICVPLGYQRLTLPLAACCVLLAALFTANCLCVARAQRVSDCQQQIGSAILRFPSLAHRLPQLCAALVGISALLGLLALVPLPVALASAVSGLGLQLLSWLMERDVPWLSVARCGQLADYALLSPLLLLPLWG